MSRVLPASKPMAGICSGCQQRLGGAISRYFPYHGWTNENRQSDGLGVGSGLTSGLFSIACRLWAHAQPIGSRPIVLLGLVLSPVLLAGQNISSPQPASLQNGKKLYAQHCAGCHGSDAHGTAQGPNLEGNRRLRQQNTDQLRTLIQHGIPAGGMPAFDLPRQNSMRLRGLCIP